MKKFEVIFRSNGVVLDEFDTLQEAVSCLKQQEADDKFDCDFEENYYEIRNSEAGEIVNYSFDRQGVLINNGFK